MVHDFCKNARARLKIRDRLVVDASDHELDHQLPQPPSAEPLIGDLAEDAAVDCAFPGQLAPSLAGLPADA